MNARDPELKKELDATLQTRKELGPEYEAELLDSFLDKLDQRLDAMVDKRVRRQMAEQQMVVARGTRQAPGGGQPEGPGAAFGLAVISLVLAIPLSAIAAVNTGLTGLFFSWAGIVGVNAVHSAGRLSWGKKRQTDDFDRD